MTNGEKYLKDNVSVEELIKQLYDVQDNNYNTNMFNCKKFFEEEAIPTLTEDERVILRNICFQPIKDFYISREHGTLKLHNKVDELYDFFAYDHLFQFVKERRRIFYRGTFERRIKMDWQGLREDFKQKHKERVAKTPQRIEYSKQEFEKQSINAELKNEQTGQFSIKVGKHTITYYCSTGKILIDNKPYEQRGIKYAIYKAKKLERRRIFNRGVAR